MPIRTLIKPSEYHDSVSLMLVGRELSGYPGIRDAAVMMGTEANKSLLLGAGLLTQAARNAGTNDLIIAVSAFEETVAEQALQTAEEMLKKKSSNRETGAFRPKTIRSAVSADSTANLAVISVAGRYAADQAWEALHLGLHVLLFSDNVTLDDEIALKRYAVDHGLLMMGPGAGTAILNGVALGFANAMPHGPVGIVSAAGTGLQEVSTLLARQGIGISQGIGTGGRDLKAEVGGLMMLAGLRALQDDQETRVILLVSKPPAESVAENIITQAVQSKKPCVVCFLGSNGLAPGALSSTKASQGQEARLFTASTLQEAALIAAHLAGAKLPPYKDVLNQENQGLNTLASELRQRLSPGQRYFRGLFSGGTLCYEAQTIWKELLDEPIYSNAPLLAKDRLADSTISLQNCAVDLGEEEFTVGRPHPMIDNDLRIRRLLQEAKDPETAVILLDIVLGYGAHPDPAAELSPAIRKAQDLASEAGRNLITVASITGTEADPQHFSRQVQSLEAAGVVICGSNAAAARLTAFILQNIPG